MNEDELKANKEVTEYVVHDLNLEPALPFPDDSFDVITNAVSVDYLNKPLEVFQEMHRWVTNPVRKI
jgi:ubiquinone/menaquinone biosynthesis C-methylase UbiE